MTVTDLAAGGLDRPEPGPVAVEESGAATVSSLLTSPDFDTYAVVLQTARQAAVALGAVVQDAAPGHIGTANIGFSVFERLVAVRRVTSLSLIHI